MTPVCDYTAARPLAEACGPAGAAGAANCAVIASINHRSGHAGTESRSRRFRPETARIGVIREGLMGPGRFSKPPPSASRPPRRTSASLRENDTYMKMPGRLVVTATRIQTVAFGVKCNGTSVLCRRLTTRSGTATWGTFLGTESAVFARSVPKTEGKRAKARGSLTVAFFRRAVGHQGHGLRCRPLDYRSKSIE